MELYRRVRGALPFLLTFIRTVDQKNFFKGQGQQVVWRVACVVRRCGLWWLVVVVCGAAWRRPRPARGKGSAVMSPAGCCHWPPR